MTIPSAVLTRSQLDAFRTNGYLVVDDVLDLRYGRPGEPTGRPSLDPCTFLVRSARSPDRILHDPKEWASTWLAMRAQLAHDQLGTGEQWAAPRWDPNAEWCA